MAKVPLKEIIKWMYRDDPEEVKRRIKEINTKYYQTHKEAIREQQRKYAKSAHGKEIMAKSAKKYRENNPEKRLIKSAKEHAKVKGLSFEIDHTDIVIPEVCPIIGIPIDTTLGGGRKKNGPSIDRIDNTKGYVKGNVQVISFLANLMKRDATPEELVAFAEGVLKLYSPESV